MGWKSTRVLTRAEAEEAYLLVKLEQKKSKWLAQANELTDGELGNFIDSLGDEPNTFGYGYYGHNFIVDDYRADSGKEEN